MPEQETKAEFKIGDTIRMVGESWFVVTVTALGTCDQGPCGEPTVFYADPDSGETDEAHAEDFELVA